MLESELGSPAVQEVIDCCLRESDPASVDTFVDTFRSDAPDLLWTV
jgi:hypothetical protein